MNIPLLGSLTPDPKIPEWLVSDPIPVALFGGQKLRFTVDGLDQSDQVETAAAIQAFLSLGDEAKAATAPYVYANYRRTAELVSAEDLGCLIRAEVDVWSHVSLSEVFVSRRRRRDKAIYVQVAAECDWEPEHGLQVVFRRGVELVRISEQDGHLTNTDACDLSEDQNRIVEGPLGATHPQVSQRKPWWKLW